MNELLLVISIIGVFSMELIVKKLLGKEGLIGWIGIASILANILITKSVNFFGIEATLGNVLFASTFLATDILTENYGYKYAQKGVKFGIASVIIFLIITQVAVLYVPNSNDIAQESFKLLFGLMPRITLASVTLYILSNVINIKFYESLRKKHDGKRMWFRNNLCTIICNGSENFLFYIIAFLGLMPFKVILSLGVFATLIEIVIALCDTPFLYISKRIK